MINHKGTQTLETDRLLLRQYEMCDAEGMFANWVTDAEVARFWGWKPHKSIEETKTLLSGWIAEYEKSDYYHWVIELKELSQVIGYIYLNEISEMGSMAAVHYLLSRKFWNRGIMTEACSRILSFAFEELGFATIRTRHHEENFASGRVLTKCGFHMTHKEARIFDDCEQLNGVYWIYQIDRNHQIKNIS